MSEHSRDAERGLVGRVWGARWKAAVLTGCLAASIAFWHSQSLPQRFEVATTLTPRDPLAGAEGEAPADLRRALVAARDGMADLLTGPDTLRQAAIQCGLLPPDDESPDPAESDRARDSMLRAALGAYAIEARYEPADHVRQTPTRVVCAAHEADIADRFTAALLEIGAARQAAIVRDALAGAMPALPPENAPTPVSVGLDGNEPANNEPPDAGEAPGDPLTIALRLSAAEAEAARLEREAALLSASAALRRAFLDRIPPATAQTTLIQVDNADRGPAAPLVSVNAPLAVDVTVGSPSRAPIGQETATAIIEEYERLVSETEQTLLDARTRRQMTDAHPEVVGLVQKLADARDLRDRAVARIGTPDLANAPMASDRADATTLISVHAALHDAERARVELELAEIDEQIGFVRVALGETTAQATALANAYERARRPIEPKSAAAPAVARAAAPMDGASSASPALVSALRELFATRDPAALALFTAQSDTSARLIGPNPIWLTGACAGLGLLAALAVCPLMALFSRRFRSADHAAETLGVPVIARIGVIDTPQVRRRRLRSRLAWAPTLAAACVATGLLGTMAYARLAAPALYETLQTRGQMVWSTFGGPRQAHATEAPMIEAEKDGDNGHNR